MDNNSIDTNTDLFNLDLDSIFEGGGDDDLFSTDNDVTSLDEGYALAADLTTVGFGSGVNTHNTNNYGSNNNSGSSFNNHHHRGGNFHNNYGHGGGGGDGNNNITDSAAQLDNAAFASLSFPSSDPIGTAANHTSTNNNNNNNFNYNNQQQQQQDSTPQLILSKPISNTCIYHHAQTATGIKILNLPPPSNQLTDTISKLAHEERLSKYLPSTVNTRRTIEISSFHGSPALYFKWINGITCEEWLDKVRNKSGTSSSTSSIPSSSHVTSVLGVLPTSSTSSLHRDDKIDYTIRLRAALAISKTLLSFHQSLVVYNSLTPDNIILTPYEGEYEASFVDLSDAVICESKEEFEGRKGVDLVSLGILLNLLFQVDGNGGGGGGRSSSSTSSLLNTRGGGGLMGGESTSESSTTTKTTTIVESRNVRKKGKQLTPGEGLPPYLGAMVCTLLVGDDEPNSAQQLKYESALDVYEDLQAILASQSNSTAGGTSTSSSSGGGENGRASAGLREKEVDHDVIIHSRLKLPKDLFYGRQVQMSMMTHLLQSATMVGDEPLMALIAGYPGTGKSTLVNQIKKPLADKNGCFIEGKFDITASRPDKVLAQALDSFFADINASNAGQNNYMSMRWRISDAVGSGVSYLFDSIPSLREFMNDGTGVDGSDRQKFVGNSVDQRLKYMYCKLISAISCRSQPLVLVLDDLQWADEMTLGVIRMLMTDPEIHHFLLLGCYRENEVNESHMLSKNLNDLRERGINFMKIKVGAIEKESINALISDVMSLPPSLCRPLSTVVHRKTGGIIMFVLRLLVSLNDEGLVWYSIASRRWMYDLEKIDLKEMPEDVVKHMMEHMGRLPGKMQTGLKICACLGPSFEEAILEKARKDADIGEDFLEACVENGFLQKEGSSSYKWSHDQVQQAAYGLIHLRQREKLHLLIGSRLLICAQSPEVDRHIFQIADNVNRGINLLETPEQKGEVAELNLKAGEKVLQQQSFHSAVKYLMTGISLLEDDSWAQKYSLTLRLHDGASQALCVIGDYSTLTALAEKPLYYARSFADKINTYSNLVRALSSSGNNDECIDTCLSVLIQLGEILPTNVTQEVYFEEVTKVRQALIGLTRQDLLSLPVMSDLNKLTAMRFLNHMLLVTYASKPPLNPIVVFRMIRMTLEYGVCNISAIAFSCYGAWLASGLNDDYDAAFTMGRVASDLMKKLGSIEVLPRVHTLVYGMINIYKEPWQALLCKHTEAYEAGLMNGDVEYAITNIALYDTLSLYGCGSNLEESNISLHKHIQRGMQYNQHSSVKTMSILEQMTYDLLGMEKNAYEEHFGGMNEVAVRDFITKNKMTSMIRTLYQKIKYVNYICGNMDEAAKHYDMQQELYANTAGQDKTGRSAFYCISTFIDGLIGLYFARKHREDEAKWTGVAEAAIEQMTKWTRSSSWNFANKLSLLKAEYFFLKDSERAYNCYKASIKQAREHRFNHEEGLAHEKLATYLLHNSKHDEALQHFQSAKKCYATWNALVLVQRIEKAIAVVSPLCNGNI